MKNITNKIIQSVAIALCLQLFVSLGNADEVGETSTQVKSKISIMPVIGLNFFNVVGASGSFSDTDAVSGMQIGATGAYDTDFWGLTLETGLHYLESGSKISGIFGVPLVETKLGYMAVPITVRKSIFNANGVEWFARAGIIPSYLVSAKQQGIIGESEDIKDSINSFNLMGHLAVGGRYLLNESYSVLTDVSYTRGFTEVTKDNGGYNQGLGLSVALSFSI